MTTNGLFGWDKHNSGHVGHFVFSQGSSSFHNESTKSGSKSDAKVSKLIIITWSAFLWYSQKFQWVRGVVGLGWGGFVK